MTDIDPVGRALPSTAASWARDGWSYVGEPEEGKSVFVAENPDPGFGPEPWRETASANEVPADLGEVTYAADTARRTQAVAVAVAAVVLLGLVIWGRRSQ